MYKTFFFHKKRKHYVTKSSCVATFLLLATTAAGAQDRGYLKRSLETISGVTMEMSTETAHYKPLFGAGDADSGMVAGVGRYGYLSVEPGGSSQMADYGREELIYYILEGTGILRYGEQEIPVSRNDFFYVPIHTEHGFSNPREAPLNIMVMGYGIPDGVEIGSDEEVRLASAHQVEFQTLEQNNHGPTSRFQLLLGTTRSRRDRIAAAYQVLSLFVIDFDHGGTNIPHRHENAEEIYFVLQGRGEMVAGQTPEGEPRRFSARAGDAYFFSRNSLVGFYSTTEPGEPHARILAIRSKYPD